MHISLRRLLLLFLVPAVAPVAQAVAWMAFNGIGYPVHANATYWDNDNEGNLKNFDTGQTLGASVSIAESNIITYSDGGVDATYAMGTDAYTRFMDNSWVYPGFVQSYDDAGVPFSQVISFSNLNPNWTYEFYITANRGGASYVGTNSRKTQFTISGLGDTPTDAHSSGVEVDGLSGVINSGYNTVSGDVVGWTNIVPDPDGTMTVTVSAVYNPDTMDYKAYSFQMFELVAIPEAQAFSCALALAVLAGTVLYSRQLRFGV